VNYPPGGMKTGFEVLVSRVHRFGVFTDKGPQARKD